MPSWPPASSRSSCGAICSQLERTDVALLASFIAGLVFGLGLFVSGMANPAKVLGFLDLAGPWEPSLGLVMAGAIVVASTAFAIAARRTRTLIGDEMKLPFARQIDLPLIGGSMLFGIGWGLAGFCPGPALAALASASPGVILFVVAMILGQWLVSRFEAP